MLAARTGLLLALVALALGCLGPADSFEKGADSLWSDRTIDQILPTLEVRGALGRRVTAEYGRRFVGYTISDLIVRVLVAPFTALAAAVLFFELKAMRGEPVLDTGGGGQIAPAGQPAGGPAPTPAEPAAPEAPPPPPGPDAPPTTGTEGTGSGPPA